jgi:HK97 family phage portal protein
MGFREAFGRWLRTGIAARRLQTYSVWETLTPDYALVDPIAYIRDGYRRNALVYRCVGIVAQAVAQGRMTAYETVGETEAPLAGGDPLSLLVERPSTEYPGQADFLIMVVTRLLLTGECPLYKVPGERSGRTVELQEILSTRIEVKKKADGTKDYLYRPDPSKAAIKVPKEDLIFLRFRDPENPDRGLSPLSAAAREADTDNDATDYRKGILKNGGTPPGVLSTDLEPSAVEREEWATKWARSYSGARNAGKTPVLGGGLKYQKTGANPDEMALPEITGLSETRICMAIGVPPIVAGAKSGLERSTYSNYGQARRSMYEDTVSPLWRYLGDELTAGLTELGDARRGGFDTSKVPALQEDADKKAERIGKAWERGAAKRNEYREAIGLPPDGDGDAYRDEALESERVGG